MNRNEHLTKVLSLGDNVINFSENVAPIIECFRDPYAQWLS